MKKILIFIISILFFYSFAFAENDINKLSKEDREQCEKMEIIHKKYFNKDGFPNQDIKNNEYQFERLWIFSTLFKKKDDNFIYLGIPNAKDPWIIKKIVAYGVEVIGITKLPEVWLRPIENDTYDYYNEGYYTNLIEYYNATSDLPLFTGNKVYDKNKIKFFKKSKKDMLRYYDNYNNPSTMFFTKEKPKTSFSYIKVKNCFVEQIHININNGK